MTPCSVVGVTNILKEYAASVFGVEVSDECEIHGSDVEKGTAEIEVVSEQMGVRRTVKESLTINRVQLSFLACQSQQVPPKHW